MKKVICVYDGIELGHGIRLTIGKIYEVNELINDNIVVITDNLGDQANYVMISDNKVWFEDATSYIRDQKLKELGI
jgi:hypothetical protein